MGEIQLSKTTRKKQKVKQYKNWRQPNGKPFLCHTTQAHKGGYDTRGIWQASHSAFCLDCDWAHYVPWHLHENPSANLANLSCAMDQHEDSTLTPAMPDAYWIALSEGLYGKAHDIFKQFFKGNNG